MSGHNRAVGIYGENIAVDYLAKKGYIIIDRNCRTPFGEIDIVAQQGEVTVFCEVKTRTTSKYGAGREAINETKRLHMLNSAQYYCEKHSLCDSTVRIDVVEITLGSGSVVHFKNALL